MASRAVLIASALEPAAWVVTSARSATTVSPETHAKSASPTMSARSQTANEYCGGIKQYHAPTNAVRAPATDGITPQLRADKMTAASIGRKMYFPAM